MKTTLSTSQAADLLKADSNASWSRAGAYALVEHLEEIEDECGEEIEFDVVSIRCDFSEYGSALEAALDQGFDPSVDLDGSGEENDDEKEENALVWLKYQTTQVIEFEGGIIVRNF
jgi:hypothetical protein